VQTESIEYSFFQLPDAADPQSIVHNLLSEMLKLVKKETLKLIDFLFEDFGFTGKNISIVFSGGRGYHIHIRDPTILKLGSDERREIVDYLTASGLDIDSLFIV